MKRLSLLFFILLLAWIIIATYWYVCKIRGHCEKVAPVSLTELPETLSTDKEIAQPDRIPEKDSVTLALDYLLGIGTRVYYFDFASAEVAEKPDDGAYIKSLQVYLRNRPDAFVTIEGHSDNRGSAEGNEKFARLRADAIKHYFIGHGINKNQIKTVSKSDTEPAASNQTEDGRRLNRRAEISIN